jgi:hypothetical protein
MNALDGGEAGLSAGIAGVSGGGGNLGGVGSGAGGGGSTLTGADLANLDLPIVESAQIEMSLGLVGKVTLELATTYDLGLKLLDSPFFAIGNTIEVQIGYPRSKRFTPWVSAITSKPSLRVSPEEGLTATINGEGGAMAALRGVSGKTYTGMSYYLIIEEIAAEHDWDIELPGDPAVTQIAEIVGGDAPEFLKKRDVVSQGQVSDWFFIQNMCRSSGCNAYLGPSQEQGRWKLFVKQRKDAFAAEPRFKFVSRGQSDFEKSFPLLEFETEAEFVWLEGGSVKTSTNDINPDTKKTEPFDATAETSPDPALGESGSANSEKRKVESNTVQLTHTEGEGRTGEFLVVSSRDPKGPKAVAQSHRDELAIRGGVTATMMSFGIPELLPGDIVQADTLGVFNGLYGINALTHTANDSEWSMSLDVINNASASGIFQQFFVKESENKNTGNVDENRTAGDEQVVNPVQGGL